MKIRHILLLSAFLLFGVAVSMARTTYYSETKHFVTVWGDFGCSTLFNNVPTIKDKAGFAPAIGVGYRYYCDKFIAQGGIEFAYMYHVNSLDKADIQLNMLDTENDPFTLHAKVGDCKDVSQTTHFQIPLLVGMEHKWFYFLAGANLGVNLSGKAASQSYLTSTASYDYLDGTMHDMDNHYLYNNKQVSSDTYNFKWNFNLMAHVEAGGRVDHYTAERGADVQRHNYRMYLAVFAEYGILNIHKNSSVGSALSFREVPNEGLQFFVVPAMVSDQMTSARVNPFTIGLKFTVAFEMPKKSVERIYVY